MALLHQQWLHPLQQFQIKPTNDTNYKQILTHITTSTTVTKHLRKIQHYDFTSQYNQYQWRHQANIAIFKPYHAHLIRRTRQAAIITIFLQFPYYLLSAVAQLNLKQTIQILQTVVCTIPVLINRYGYFQITQYMVGFNNKQSKIWINSDFTINKPQYKAENEEQMVRDIVIMLKNRTEISSQAAYFFNRVSKLGYKLSSILQILKQIDGIEQVQKICQQQIAQVTQQVLSEFGSISDNVTNQSQCSLIDQIPQTSLIQKYQEQQQQSIYSPPIQIKLSEKISNQMTQLKDYNRNMDSTQATKISQNQFYGSSPSNILKLEYCSGNQLFIKPCLFKPNIKNYIQNPQHISTQQSIQLDDQLNFPSILESRNWKNNFQFFLKKNNQEASASILIQDGHHKPKQNRLKQLKIQKYGYLDQVFLSIIQDEAIKG